MPSKVTVVAVADKLDAKIWNKGNIFVLKLKDSIVLLLAPLKNKTSSPTFKLWFKKLTVNVGLPFVIEKDLLVKPLQQVVLFLLV